MDKYQVTYFIIALAIYLPILRYVIMRFLEPPAVKILLVVNFIAAVIVAISFIPPGVDKWGAFFNWYFSLNGEYNPVATFSAVQLIAVGLTAFSNGLWTSPEFSKISIRVYWFVLMLIYVLMAGDEYFVWHEQYTWKTAYLMVGIFIGIISLLTFWFSMERKIYAPFIFLFIGLGVQAAGGMALEKYTAARCYQHIARNPCLALTPMEELLEMLEVGLVLAGFVSYAARYQDTGHSDARQWQKTKYTLAGGTVFFAMMLIGHFWVWQAIEARLFATKTDTRYYYNQALSLEGYRLSDEVLAPGDTLHVHLYWHTSDWLPDNFGVSSHLLSYPEGRSITQIDEPVIDPNPVNWVPGMTRKISYTLEIPDDIETPGSYMIGLTIWHRYDRYVWQPVNETDLPTLDDHTVILTRVAVVNPDGNPPVPANKTLYSFNGIFSLTGYEIPEEIQIGEPFSVKFHWTTQKDEDTTLVQFLHFVQVEGNGLFAYDSQPFGERFPTSDWPADIRMLDEWQVTIPGDIPPGQYEIYTGMYDPLTTIRYPIKDKDGHTMANDMIPLGTVTVDTGNLQKQEKEKIWND